MQDLKFDCYGQARPPYSNRALEHVNNGPTGYLTSLSCGFEGIRCDMFSAEFLRGYVLRRREPVPRKNWGRVGSGKSGPPPGNDRGVPGEREPPREKTVWSGEAGAPPDWTEKPYEKGTPKGGQEHSRLPGRISIGF